MSEELEKENMENEPLELDPTEIPGTEEPQKPRHRVWRIVWGFFSWLLGFVLGTAILAAVLLLGGYGAFKIFWTPDRLTQLIEEYAPRFIDGDLKVKHVDISFLKTFPKITLTVDSLTLTSRAFDRLPEELRREMPLWSDTLLTLKQFTGCVDIGKLREEKLELYDVVLDNPSFNIVVANDTLANYDIVKPSEEPEDTTAESPVKISAVSINHFKILSSGPLRYYSRPDDIDFDARIDDVSVDGTSSPSYALHTEGGVVSSLLKKYGVPSLEFAFNGAVTWDFDNGVSDVTVDDLGLSLGDLDLSLSTTVELKKKPVVKALKLDVPIVSFKTLKHYLDINMPDLKLPALQTDAVMGLDLALTKPYVVDQNPVNIPSVDVNLNVPDCYVKMPEYYLNISRFALQTSIHVDGDDLNRSTVEIPKLLVNETAVDLDMRGMITEPIDNPRLAGEVQGRVFLDKLPQIVLSMLPGTFKGTIGLNTAFRFHRNELNEKDFHKIYARGAVSFRDIDFNYIDYNTESGNPDTLKLYTPLTMLRFDADKNVESNGFRVDSLLSVSLTSDTLSYAGAGMDVRLKNLSTSFGTKNTASSIDRSQINPFGGRISMERLQFRSEEDSTRLMLSDLSADAKLTRYADSARLPLIALNVEARRIGAGTPSARLMLGRPKFTLTANMNAPRQRRGGNVDSSLASDSIPQPRRQRLSQATATPEDSTTRGLRRLLNRWTIHGDFTAGRARLFTPAFPVRNTISDVKLHFTNDSIRLRSLKLKAGESDFQIKGYISDIKASLRRRNPEPLKVRFSLQSDTINIDELSRVVFAGAAADTNNTALWDDSIDETTDVESVIDIDTTKTAAFIVPKGLDAALRIRAKNVIYTGMLLHKFKGEMDMWDQAIHLHELEAQSPMGNLTVSALYNGPSENKLEFGMGMRLTDFHIEKFLELTPAVRELLPAIQDFSGIINADIALTTKLFPDMDFDIPSVQADIKIDGDSLVLLDAETFKTMSKWLFFKNKKHNMIDHMSVELQVDSAQIILYPFIFNIDRYKLGVMGSNDLDMNFNYHVSVLKSPIPFKFGINISGNPDKFKIRTGGAKIKENTVVERMAINTNARINLIEQLEGVFRRGANTPGGGRAHIHQDEGSRRELKRELKAEGDSLDSRSAAILDSDNPEEAAQADESTPEPHSFVPLKPLEPSAIPSAFDSPLWFSAIKEPEWAAKN